jgi:muconolactone delta-isomerase
MSSRVVALPAARRLAKAVRVAALLAVLVVCFAAASPPPGAQAANPIVTENQQPGTSAWELGTEATDAGAQIKGYASATSVNKGDPIDFFVSVNPAQTYTIDIYRMGYYQGLGGRLVQHIGALGATQQPTCPTDSTTGLSACNWARSYTLQTQSTWTTGVYQAVLTNAAHYQNAIIFVVRDDSRVAQLLYQLPVNTYQAYNNYPDNGKTGKSLYTYNSYGANTVTGGPSAAKVSFDRPYNGPGYGQFLAWDVNLVRWLEKSGYDVSYTTDVDTDANPSRLLAYRGFLAAAHNEYWSKSMFDAVTAARDAGVNIAFFGANAIYWQVRYEPSAAGVANRTLVCYKDRSIDPTTDPSLTTVNWRDPVLNRPEQTLIGVQYTAEMRNDAYYPYVVTNSSNWVYAGTGFRDGDSVSALVGYEGDHYFSTYPAPTAVAGTFTLLSRSPYTNSSGAADFANSSIYQAPSGAWVFGSGTIAWSWGLDDYGNRGALDARIQQTTANILNRFVASYARPKGATPLRVSLVPAYKPCTSADRQHGAPLSYGSCNPPSQASDQLTVGTPDANGQAARSIGSVRYDVMPGDVRIAVSITDVRNKGDLSDYTGQLQADQTLRITDLQNGPSQDEAGTTQDIRFPVSVQCAASADTTVGSTCAVSTTADAVVPGSVSAANHTIWQLGQVQVFDGGSSGTAGAPDARLFEDQGVFVP